MQASDAVAGAVPTEPFLWPGERLGCLLVHGLTSTPYEMRSLGERLHAGGSAVCAVQLAGHGARVADLEPRGRRDWYASVEEGLARLSAGSSRVIAIGLSLGALLVLRLAHDRRESVAGVVVLSTVLELANPWPARLAPIVAPFLPMLPERLRFRPKDGSDIADLEARRIHPGLQSIPLRSIVELVALQREVRSLLAEIRQPVLAMHGAGDHTAPLSNLEILRRSLPRLEREVVLPGSCHVVTVDVDRERVAAEVARFVDEVQDA